MPTLYARSSLLKSLRLAAAASIIISVPFAAIAQGTTTLSQKDKVSAIKAVQNTLPSVAVLGQKAGPSDTIEVFIQVPGVLNMQSVYVLSDRSSVISGVVIPPISGSYPGGQLELPTGQATVDPRQPRTNMNQFNQVLGIDAPSQAANAPGSVPSPSGKMSPAAPTPPPSTSPAAIPMPPNTTTSFNEGRDGTIPNDFVVKDRGAQSGYSTASNQLTAAAADVPATVSASSVGLAPSEANMQSREYRSKVIESLSDVNGSRAFGAAVNVMLDQDKEIQNLRGLSADPEAQRAEFLGLVKTLPAVIQGSSDRKVFVMFDPNCPVCHRYYAESLADVNAGRLEIHWIPSIVFPDNRSSITSSAALIAELDRDDGDAPGMLRNMMTRGDFTSMVDRSPGVDRLVPYLDPVVKNTALMSIADPATPLVIFEHKVQGLAIVTGVPDDGYIDLIEPN
jgi:protein-disulfide isomerase